MVQSVELSKLEGDRMVQEFMVVRCYRCEAFQVQQVSDSFIVRLATFNYNTSS